MSTPGNVVTSTEEVLNEIVAQLATVEGLNTGNVWISAVPFFLQVSIPGDQYVQVVPGAAIDSYAGEGIGYTADQVKIVVFKRLLLDMAQQDTQKIANASVGILQLVQLITNKLTQNFLNAKLTSPLLPMRRDAANSAPVEAMGWVSMERVFQMRYLIDFSAPQAMVS